MSERPVVQSALKAAAVVGALETIQAAGVSVSAVLLEAGCPQVDQAETALMRQLMRQLIQPPG